MYFPWNIIPYEARPYVLGALSVLGVLALAVVVYSLWQDGHS